MTDRSTRLTRLRETLQHRGLDGALISHPANRRYLTGFTADDVAPDGSAAVLLVGPDQALLFTGATNAGWAASESPGWEVRAWERPWESTIGKTIDALGWRRLGFEPNALTVAGYERLQDAVPAGTDFHPLASAVESMREIKDDDELATLERALALTDRVFVDATSGLTAGVTERELAMEIDRLFREHADGPAFGTIVAVGDHAARPHHAPSDRPITEGEPIIIDMGALVDGYHADLTRTIWVGEPSERLKAVYNVVHQAQQAAIAAIQPGCSARAVDAAAREVIAAAGFGDHFVHGLGHGIGLRIHEGPSMSKTSDDVLRSGQVTTIEPGVYLKDWGGVRIEDIGVVEPDGFRIITRAPKNALVI